MHHETRTRTRVCLALMASAFVLCGAMCGGGLGGPMKKHKSKTRLDNNGKNGAVQNGQFDLGEAAYKILLADLERGNGPCKAKRIANLKARHAEFVYAVNTIFAGGVRKGLVPTLNHLLVLVDTGIVPRITGDVANILRLLRDDTETLDAIVALSDSSKSGFGVLDRRAIMRLVSRFLQFPEVEELIYALAEVLDNDSRGLVDSGLTFVSNALKDVKTKHTEDESEPGEGLRSKRVDMVAELLKEIEIVGDDRLGQPVWVPVLDKNGKPQAAVDAVSKAPVSPFVDKDGNGEADRNAAGDLVDAAGNAVTTSVFDGDGSRRTNGNGQFLYQYVDAKRTALSGIVQMLATGVEKGLHRDIASLFEHAAGTRVPYDNGTADTGDDYMGFAKDTPLVELNHGMLEFLKYEHLPKLLETLAVLLEEKKDLAEELLVNVGKVIEIGRRLDAKKAGSGTPATPGAPADPGASPRTDGTGSASPGLLNAIGSAVNGGTAPANGTTPVSTGVADSTMTDELLVLADELCRVDAGNVSTVRLLMQVIHDLGQTARDVPIELARMFEYVSMVRGDDGDGDQILQAQSVKADWTKPAVYTDGAGNTVENRSAMQRLNAMITATDACQVPFLNQSIAELYLGLLADMTPDTAATLNDVMIQITGLQPAIADALCPGMAANIESLGALATSGILDALIPIAKAFKNRGQLRVFIEILKLQDKHAAALRESEEKVVEVLKSGMVEKLFDVLAVMVEIKVPDTQTDERMADVFADFLRHLVDRSNANLFRFDGSKVPALVYLVLGPMRDLDKMLKGTSAEKAQSNLMTGALDLLVERKTLADPAGGSREVLKNRFVIPLLAKGLRFVVDKLGEDQEKRIETVEEYQKDFADTIASRKTVNLVDLLIVFRDTPSSGAFDRALVSVLRANPDPTRDVYAVVVKLVSMGIQTKVKSDAAARQVAYFFGVVMEPGRGVIRNAITGLSEVFRRDQGKVILSMVRNAVWMGPDGDKKTPAESLLDIMKEVGTGACDEGTLTRDSLVRQIDGALLFLSGNQKGGLQAIYAVIKNRRR